MLPKALLDFTLHNIIYSYVIDHTMVVIWVIKIFFV